MVGELRLERSCPRQAPADLPAGDGDRVERLRIRMHERAYAMHRHDSYAVGLTLAGVQSFWFRGARRYSLPGQSLIIHPDEPHDGSNGDDEALDYLMLYVAPADLQTAMAETGVLLPLPFVRGAVRRDPVLAIILRDAFEDFPAPLSELAETDLLARLGQALRADGGRPDRRRGFVDWRAVRIAREMLEERRDGASAAELEAATGVGRYALARQFRAAFGVSPHQYGLGRRLRRARALIGTGHSLADTASLCGFADQSHLTRHFRSRSGLTPGAFRRCV